MWNVLIVEDNTDDCKKVIDGIKSHAHCTIASNGEAALQIYKRNQSEGSPFDFIILDVELPHKNGFEVLKSIRSIEEAYASDGKKETFIIMVTTHKDSLMENYNMGWNEFITKPVDPKILIDHMTSMISPSESQSTT